MFCGVPLESLLHDTKVDENYGHNHGDDEKAYAADAEPQLDVFPP